MATDLKVSFTVDVEPSRLHAAVSSKQYWLDLVATVAPDTSTLTSVDLVGDTMTVELEQRIPEEKLPSLITSIRKGDLVIHRTMSWGPLQGASADGSFKAVVEGAPAEVNGDSTLSADPVGSRISFDGVATVKIPFVGGKVESAIVENLHNLIEAEHEFTQEWIKQH